MGRLRGTVSRVRRQARGASAISYALVLALVGVVCLVAIAATGDRVSDLFDCFSSRVAGIGSSVCDVVEDTDLPGPPTEPPEDTTLADLSFEDTIAEPSQYAVSRDKRITGLNAPVTLSIGAAEADAGAQISIGGKAWTTGGSVSDGQSVRLRMRASAVYGESRVATVNVSDGTSTTWTVTVRDQDRDPDLHFTLRPTPWVVRPYSSDVVLIPYADVSLAEARFTAGYFPLYGQNTGDPYTRVANAKVAGFDGPLALTASIEGLDGAVGMVSRNGSPWTESTVDLMPNDIIGIGVRVPANAFGADFSVKVQLGDYETAWSVKTRPADTTPDALTFARIDDLPPGNGSTYVTSQALPVTGIEWPAQFALGASPPAGAGMRVCTGGAGCDPAAGDGAGGWSGWSASASACNGCLLQLRVLVPAGQDGEAPVDIVAGTETEPFSTRWTVTTVTDGPDVPTIKPITGATPGTPVTSAPITLRGTVKPVTVTLGLAGATLSSGTLTGRTQLTVNPGDSFTVSVTAPAGYMGEPQDSLSVPLTIRGADSNGDMQTWSAAWTPPPALAVSNRALDARAAAFTFKNLAQQELDSDVAGEATLIAGFDRTLPVTVSGPAGSFVSFGSTTVGLGETAQIAPNSQLVPHVHTAAGFDTDSVLTVTVGSGADAVSGSFTARTRALSTGPASLTFEPVKDALPGIVQLSEVKVLDGFDTPLQLTISGEGNPQFRLGTSASWSDADWQVGPATISAGQELQLRWTTSAVYGGTRLATLAAGTGSGAWALGTIADTLAFDDIEDAEPGATVFSNKVLMTGLASPAPATLSLGGATVLLVDGTETATPATVADGSTVQLRTVASTELKGEVQSMLTLGVRQAGWRVATREAAAQPKSFAFPPLVDVVAGSGRLRGESVALEELDTPLPASTEGQLNGTFSVDGGAFAASGTVSPGAHVQMEVDAPEAWATTNYAVLRVGSGTGLQPVTTRERLTCPALSFDPPPGSIGGNTEVLSDEVTVAGVDGTLAVEISATAPAAMRVNRGDWGSAGSVKNGDSVQLRVKTPATSNASAKVLVFFETNCAKPWTVNATQPKVAFADALKVEPGSALAIDGTPKPLSGVGSGLALSVQSGMELKLSVNGGAPAASVTASDGDAVQLVGTAPATFGTAATALVTVGDVDTLLTVTTRTANRGVAGLGFASVNTLEPGVEACSSTATLTGFDEPLTLTVSGDATAYAKVQGGTSGTAVTVAPGAKVQLCFTAPIGFGLGRSIIASVPGQSVAWNTSTRAKHEVPSPTLAFEALYGAPQGQTVSQSFPLEGFDGTLTATVAAAGADGWNSQPRLSVNGADAGAGPVTVKSGDLLTVSLRTRNLADTFANAQVTVGSAKAVWQTYTGVDNVPDPFDFNQPNAVVEAGQDVTSNEVTVSGFVGTLTMTLSGNGSATIVLNGTDTGSDTADVVTGDKVKIRTLAPATYDTRLVTTATLGPYYADPWPISTRGGDNQPDPFAVPAVTGVDPGKTVTSAVVPVAGFDGGQYMSVAQLPAGTAEFSRDGGLSWASAGSVFSGDNLLFRATAKASFGQDTVVSIGLGAALQEWHVTTRPRRTDGQLSFAALSEQVQGRQVSATPATLAGYDGPGTLSFSDRSAGLAELSVNGGPWTTSAQVTEGDVIGLRMTVASTDLTTYTATLALESKSFGWSVTSEVSPPKWVTLAGALAPAVIGEAYAAQLQATASTQYPLAGIQIVDGALPAGLSLASNGAISGTATGPAQTASVTVTATDTRGRASAPLSLTIAVGTRPAWITGASLGQINLGETVPSSLKLQLDSGLAASFAVTGGTLPAGVTLGPDGSFSGYPTAETAYSFTAVGTLSNGIASLPRTFSITIKDNRIFTSCRDAQVKGKTANGVYPISLPGLAAGVSSAPVYCDQTTDGGGWALAVYATGTDDVNVRSGSQINSYDVIAAQTGSGKWSDAMIRAYAQANAREFSMRSPSTVYIQRPNNPAKWSDYNTTGTQWTSMWWDSKRSNGTWVANACNGWSDTRGFTTYNGNAGGPCATYFAGGPGVYLFINHVYGYTIPKMWIYLR